MASDSKAELMTAYLDDALEGEDAKSFEKLLEESPEARREFEDLQKVLSIVRDLPEVEAPPDFYENVAKKLRRRRAGGDGVLSVITLPFQVISVFVIMVIAATYLMIEIDDENAKIEKDPSASKVQEQADR
jgi:anti-sigma factor RsiW